MEPFDLAAWLSCHPTPAPIVPAGASVLRRRAADVPTALLGSAALAHLVDLLVATMRAAPGVGLAAPQVGVPLRVFVAEDSPERIAQLDERARAERGREPLPLLVLVNPTVAAAGTQRATFFEGCLSVRGYGALVPRAAAVTVQAYDPSGRSVSYRMQGWAARIMQHEADHLDGTLYVDRMIARSFAADTELQRLAALPVAEVVGDLAIEGA